MQKTATSFVFLFLILLGLTTRSYAQVPATCFEIESILVDACVPGGGCTNSSSPACNCEGKNEMIRFRIGPAAINVSNITISWPNNSFPGIVQNATTATLVAQLNATIQSCGWLVEPSGGVLPAGKQVLLISSTDMCTTANSFAALSDTIIVIFQDAGNYQGHFANHNNGSSPTPAPTGPSSTRTLIMTHIPNLCADTVTYDRSLLVNTLGTYGGSTSQNDGSTVEFTWPGLASYVNRGCQAPFIPLGVTAGAGSSGCSTSVFSVSATTTGTVASVLWQGGTGVISAPNNSSTNYTPGVGETGNVILTILVIGACGDTVSALLTLTVSPPPVAVITAGGPTTICSGDSVQLTASGGISYLWSTGDTTAAIYASAAGTYTVLVTNACGSDSTDTVVTIVTSPAATIAASGPATFCSGDSLLLTAGGGNTFLWSTGATTPSIVVTTAGTFSVIVTSSCGTDTASLTTATLPLPLATVSASGPATICPGDTVQLTAGGGGSYLWSTGDTTVSIAVPAAGTYTVQVTNTCGSDTVSFTVSPGTMPQTLISGNTVICPGDAVVLTAGGASSYLWSTGDTTVSITVTAPGTYLVLGSNSCGSLSASFTVTLSSVTAAFLADSLTGLAPLAVNFTSQSFNASGYNWDFGDNNGTSTVADPSYTYTSGGIYSVTLTVVNTDGCTDTATITIFVIDEASVVSIPNVFTPNSDGINDVLLLTTAGLSKLHLTIYDRWGVPVYSQDSINASWDGRTTSGSKASDGTYYYYLVAEGFDKKIHELTGFITLIK